MKVLPKFKSYNHLFNEEDLDGFHIEYILPKRSADRDKLEKEIREREQFYDTFYDEKEEIDTYVKNLLEIPMSKWTKEQKSAYAQYLLDSHSESLT